MERLAPLSPGHIDPQKHQIGRLRIGKSPMNDPPVSASRQAIKSASSRGKRYGGSVRDRHHKTPSAMVGTGKQTYRQEGDSGEGCRLDLNQ